MKTRDMDMFGSAVDSDNKKSIIHNKPDVNEYIKNGNGTIDRRSNTNTKSYWTI